MPKKKQIKLHYLCFNGDGKAATAAAKADTLNAAKQYVEHVYEEKGGAPGERTGLIYGTALRLNQIHKELLDTVELSLTQDVVKHTLFSDYPSIEAWMNAHNIRHSAAAISRCRSLAEVIIPWCIQNEVFPGFSPLKVEQWFMTLNREARSVVSRVGHVAPIIKRLIADVLMEPEERLTEVRRILSLVADPEIENEELMRFARKFYWDKATGSFGRLPDGAVVVVLKLESMDQFEYLRDRRLKSFVNWEEGDLYDAPNDPPTAEGTAGNVSVRT